MRRSLLSSSVGTIPARAAAEKSTRNAAALDNGSAPETGKVPVTLYDELIQDAIDIHCHIDFEFSTKERKREPEAAWLPKAEAMGVRGVVLKSHWWPTINVVPYILASVQTSFGPAWRST